MTRPAASQILDVRELNTRQISALDRSHTVVLLSGGILEEHGPYLPAYSDGYQSEFVAMRIAESVVARPGWAVLRFPPLPLGSFPANEIGEHFSFPGSYPIRSATLRAVVMDLVTDLGDAGFRQIVLVSLHGGPTHNLALDDAATYFNDTFDGRMIHVTGLVSVQGAVPHDLFSSAERAQEGFSVHADADEHSRMLFLRPDLVARDYASAPPTTGNDLHELRGLAKNSEWAGYFGTPGFATATAGSRAMNAIAQAAVDVVMSIIDGARIDALPRVSDLRVADPDVQQLTNASLEHERHVERRETEWLAKRKP